MACAMVASIWATRPPRCDYLSQGQADFEKKRLPPELYSIQHVPSIHLSQLIERHADIFRSAIRRKELRFCRFMFTRNQ
jgi:hypothetical protein